MQDRTLIVSAEQGCEHTLLSLRADIVAAIQPFLFVFSHIEHKTLIFTTKPGPVLDFSIAHVVAALQSFRLAITSLVGDDAEFTSSFHMRIKSQVISSVTTVCQWDEMLRSIHPSDCVSRIK